MVLIDFFVLNLNPISASLKSLALQGQRSILRLILIFQQMKFGDKCLKRIFPRSRTVHICVRYPASESESRTLKR